MKVFIAGGAGFVGQHLARRLASEGHSVRIYDKVLPKEGNGFCGDINRIHMYDFLQPILVLYLMYNGKCLDDALPLNPNAPNPTTIPKAQLAIAKNMSRGNRCRAACIMRPCPQ